MKEKLDERKTQTCFFRKRFSFEKYGRGKERSKKKLNFSKEEDEKKRSFQKEKNFVFVRMQGLFI